MPPATPDSLPAQLRGLAVGASLCLAQKLDQDDAGSRDLLVAEERLHNTGRSAISRAAADGRKYEGETLHARTNARKGANPVVLFLITRTA